MFTEKDLKQFEQRGVSTEQVEAQLRRFSRGFPTLRIVKSATVGSGIIALDEKRQEAAMSRWKEYLDNGGEVLKFVPASGAASRMFKALFEFAAGATDSLDESTAARIFLTNVEKFAFFEALDDACRAIYGCGVSELKSAGRNRDVVKALLDERGLNYGNLPKGLLLFHRYADSPRTPLEEHIVEGVQTALNSRGEVNLHFTVSESHFKLFEKKIAGVVAEVERRKGVKINISLSVQKPVTDTVAATPQGDAFRDENGDILFRPGGHGALIENLNDVDSAVVFIKNIDNVVPDKKRDETIKYKCLLAGFLMEIRDRVAAYRGRLLADDFDDDELTEIVDFVKNVLFIDSDVLRANDKDACRRFILNKFDRPMRVCGMVKNEGEPGGGPFITINPDGSASPQILESSQIAPEYKELMTEATHFNPVDLVCYTKDFDGNKYNLPEYVDAETGFISSKSQHGRELQALELPGLWNGAMSDWTTLFVEVPVATFNPVKTVNDLLRPMHQND